MKLPAEVKTESGVTLSLGEITPSEMLDLIEAAGTAAAGPSMGAWMMQAQAIASVRSINGVPVVFPESKGEVKSLANRIGNDGLVAIFEAMRGARDAGAATDEAALAKN